MRFILLLSASVLMFSASCGLFLLFSELTFSVRITVSAIAVSNMAIGTLLSYAAAMSIRSER